MKHAGCVIICLIFICLAIPAMAADVIVPGVFQANSFSGDGSSLSNINPANISAGTANINISGNAATATSATTVANGIYSSGSYGDPSWITSLDGSKLSKDSVTSEKIAFYGNVAVVAASGGNYTDPAAAMADYSTWCKTTPCLLKIMPGTYTVTSPVVMAPYIDIEGSGEKTTKITSAICTGSVPNEATLAGTSNSEMRFLTIENTCSTAILNSGESISMVHVTAAASGKNNVYGVYNYYASPTMINVTITVSGVFGGYNYMYGIYNNNSSPIMNNVTATVSGTRDAYCFNAYGVYDDFSSPMMNNVVVAVSGAGNNYGVFNCTSSSPTMNNVSVTASGTSSYGVYNNNYCVYSGVLKIKHSVIKGAKNSIISESGTTYVADTELNGAVASGGTFACVGAYNSSYVALGATCQ
jgi:hypothetical protein